MRIHMRSITHTGSPRRSVIGRSAITLVSALALCAALGAGCSSKDSATAPPPVTGPSFNFAFPTAGQSVEFTFATAGSYSYRCAAHPSMTGTVVVNAGAPVDSALVEVGYSNTNTFDPPTVTILPGGRVRWQRLGSNVTSTHTVTRP